MIVIIQESNPVGWFRAPFEAGVVGLEKQSPWTKVGDRQMSSVVSVCLRVGENRDTGRIFYCID